MCHSTEGQRLVNNGRTIRSRANYTKLSWLQVKKKMEPKKIYYEDQRYRGAWMIKS